MRLARATKNYEETYGVVIDNFFFNIRSDIKKNFPTLPEFIAAVDKKLGHQSNEFSKLQSTFETKGYPLSALNFLPPTTERNKIICVGINYPKLYNDKLTKKPDHIILFSKFHESLVGHNEPLLLPSGKAKNTFDYEAEIAVVIGKAGFKISRNMAKKHIFGYTLFNDGSVRDWQKHSIQAGKNFYHSGACGPYIVTRDEISSNVDINFNSKLNKKLVQTGKIDDMFFSISQIIEYISSILPLYTGDIIATGSPEGTGASQHPKRFLRRGDTIEISSKMLGTLTNNVT